MSSHDVKLHEDVAELKAHVELNSERTERIEEKVDHIDACVDSLKNSLFFFKGRIGIISALLGGLLSIVVDKLIIH